MVESDITENDVLLGRGAGTTGYVGNRRYRSIVSEHQDEYLRARKNLKALIAKRIVAIVHQNGGRFLQQDAIGEKWVEIENEKAQYKTAQALRDRLYQRKKFPLLRTDSPKGEAMAEMNEITDDARPQALREGFDMRKKLLLSEMPPSDNGPASSKTTTVAFTDVKDNDVLMGRGSGATGHIGNRRFRSIVTEHQKEYLRAQKKVGKTLIAGRIVAIVHRNGGRFLRRDSTGLQWEEVTNKKAQQKSSKALWNCLNWNETALCPSKMSGRDSDYRDKTTL